jgi:ATP-binding protein involved in chromosome partitioning
VDADLYGPDVPRMLGLRRDVPARSITVASWAPGAAPSRIEAMEADGIKVASVGFLIGGAQGLSTGSTVGSMLLNRLFRDTDWGDIDALVVDLPPGTGEVHQAVLGLVGQITALLVVTPAEVAHLDSGRALTVLETAHVPILGGVENMAYLECRGCHERTPLHVPAPEERTIWARGVRKLASLPYRPETSVTSEDLSSVLAVAAKHIDA